MPELKTGARLKSAVCDGEIMVVSTPGGDINLTCGGAPMVDAGADADRVDIVRAADHHLRDLRGSGRHWHLLL